jgi:hypothetical protein
LPSFPHFSFAEHWVPSESSSSSTDFGICPSSPYKSTWFLHSISTVKVFLAHNSFLLSSRSEENFFRLYFFFKSLSDICCNSELVNSRNQRIPPQTLLFLFRFHLLGHLGFCLWVDWFCDYNFLPLFAIFIDFFLPWFCFGDPFQDQREY